MFEILKNLYYRFIGVLIRAKTVFYICLLNCRYPSPKLPLSKSWIFYGMPRIVRVRTANLKLGRNLILSSSFKSNVLGNINRVLIAAQNHGSELIIGDNVGISSSSVVAYKSIKIGNNVLIGAGSLITDTDAHPINYWERNNANKTKSEPIIIEDDVFIGTRSIILKGITIGRGSVVGAGSVVVKSVEPFTIVGGNPAKKIGEIKKIGR